MEAPTTACIVGAGPGGISMGYQLKKVLRCDDFAIFDQNAGIGGTWYSNTYPGCGKSQRLTPVHDPRLTSDWARLRRSVALLLLLVRIERQLVSTAMRTGRDLGV